MGLDASFYQDAENEICLRHIHIGNVAMVWYLAEEIEKNGKFPLILERVLYSGSHCGDEIAANSIADLKDELIRLPDVPSEVRRFKDGLIALCEIALKQNRPITF